MSADGAGRFKRFQSGALYFHPTDSDGAFGDEAHVVFGNYYLAYQDNGPMGFPEGDRDDDDFATQFFKIPNQVKGGNITTGTAHPIPGFKDGNDHGVFVGIPGVTIPDGELMQRRFEGGAGRWDAALDRTTPRSLVHVTNRLLCPGPSAAWRLTRGPKTARRSPPLVRRSGQQRQF